MDRWKEIFETFDETFGQKVKVLKKRFVLQTFEDCSKIILAANLIKIC